MDYKDHVPAAERTLRILEIIVASQTGLTAAEISSMLNIPRSAVYALLNTLLRFNYVEQESPRKPYKPGPRLWHLNRAFKAGSDALVNAFNAETTTNTPEETFALVILSSRDIVYIAQTQSKYPVRCVMRIGERENAAQHPGGWTLLAGLSEFELTQTFIPLTTDLMNLLAKTRQTVMCQSQQDEMMMISIPICSDGYHPNAALILCCPIYRWSSERINVLTKQARETATRISYRLGAQLYNPYQGIDFSTPDESVPMSDEELASFLQGPWTASLACIREDGSPHVVPIWYEWQQGSFLIVAWPKSMWASLVKENPSVALTIDEPWPPMRRVLIRGEAQHITQGTIKGGIEILRRRIQRRYLGNGHSLADLSASASAKWSAFRITPLTCVALKQRKSDDGT
jgi:DNA-binding IclR family transcriptional regulator